MSLEEFDLGRSTWDVARPWELPFVEKPLPLDRGLGFTEYPPVLAEHAPRAGVQQSAKHPVMHPTGRTRPIEHVFRGMSQAEWDQARERGFVQSDQRGNLFPGWEGTNAAARREEAEGYLRDNIHRGHGVVVQMAVHPDDGWFATDADGYLRTRRPVPIHRVLQADQFHDQDFSDRLDQRDAEWGKP